MVHLNRETFETQMKAFSATIQCGITKIAAENYYENLKYIKDSVFCRSMTHLLKTWKFKYFPLIADIIRAIKETEPTPEYKPLPRFEGQYKGELAKIYRVVYPAMDEIRKEVVRLYKEKYKINSDVNTQQTYELMKMFYADKIKKNEVYDIDGKKWIKDTDSGNIFNPAEYGFTDSPNINRGCLSQ